MNILLTSVGRRGYLADYFRAAIGPGGHCRIGDRVTVGAGAVVFDHVCVGADSIVGGGSVVTKDVPPGVVALGNPCKVIKENSPA